MKMKRSYQRKHLRSPYFEEVLFVDDDFVFKAKTLNISEGGILLDQLPHFPEAEQVPILLSLPQYPYFKNFTIEKMREYTPETFSRKVIRAKCKMVRREGGTTSVDDVFKSRIGIQFTQIGVIEQKAIADYVSVFSSNLIYLLMLIDSYNTDDDIKEKVDILSRILGYQAIKKISQLRVKIQHDYQSLQWL